MEEKPAFGGIACKNIDPKVMVIPRSACPACPHVYNEFRPHPDGGILLGIVNMYYDGGDGEVQ